MKLNMHLGSISSRAVGESEFGYVLKGDGRFVPENVDAIQFRCPRASAKRICSIQLTLGAQTDPSVQDPTRRWHWDGNMETPTITPSIGCDAPPRCGWHGHVTKGEWK